MTGWKLALHLWIYRRSGWYRWGWGWWITFGLARLQGYSRFDAILSIVAHERLGTKMYYYPKWKREQMPVNIRRTAE